MNAEAGLNSKYDFFDRLFIVQYHLARYLESGDKAHVIEIDNHYQGVRSLKALSRSNLSYEEMMWLAKYFDAAIPVLTKDDPQTARKLLDSYCPITDYKEKMRCHVMHYVTYEDNAATGGTDRYNSEISFLIDLGVGTAYHDAKFTGHALKHLVQFDVTYAQKRASAYLERNAWNDVVMQFYCKELDQYQEWPDVRDYEKYLKAFNAGHCPVYLGVASNG